MVLDMSQTSSMITIGFIISTAPLLGVFMGGYLADKI